MPESFNEEPVVSAKQYQQMNDHTAEDGAGKKQREARTKQTGVKRKAKKHRKKKQKEIEQSARDCSCKTCISMKMSMQYEDYEEMAQYEDYEALVQFENNKVLPAR